MNFAPAWYWDGRTHPPRYLRAALVTPPTETPVSLVEAKAHLRKDDDDEDALIDGLIAAATAHLDGATGILGRCLVTQTWRQDLDRWPCDGSIRLPLSPLQTIESVQYIDLDGATQTLAPENYVAMTDALGPAVLLVGVVSKNPLSCRPDAVRVTFTAGYGAATVVPMAIKQAMLLLIGHWFENREAVQIGQAPSEMPIAVDALLRPFREVHF